MWRDEAYLLDMLLAARKVRQFTADVTWEKFASDEILQHALMRLITIIGEAAGRVSVETREADPEIAWRDIIGMRHRVVHDYFKVDLEKVWDAVQNDITHH